MKYPIVLVHGIAALDRTKLFDFWGRIPEVLRQKGLKVYLGNTDSWGDFETNAGLLKETIDAILKETKSSKVHIIAHSKGGLDARYLIWKHDYADKIASLVTISTPHGGSELADLVLRQKSLHSMFARRSLKILGKAFLDTNPDPYKAFRDISTAYMTEFNERVRLPKDIFFQGVLLGHEEFIRRPDVFYRALVPQEIYWPKRRSRKHGIGSMGAERGRVERKKERDIPCGDYRHKETRNFRGGYSIHLPKES